MFFQRDILSELTIWSQRSDRKPLVLRGARQVGKTSVVNQFASQFDNYLYINLYEDRAAQIVENAPNVSLLLISLFAYCNKNQKKGQTLLFLDEIQNSPKAVMMLRFFYEQMPELYVIAAGSLLESLIDRHISFPVGRVEYLAMRPVSFREFLVADNKSMLRQRIESNFQLSVVLHQQLIDEFKLFSLIGGMPAVVQNFVENHDLIALNRYYDTLINGYSDDVEKYASNKTQIDINRYILIYGWFSAGRQIVFNNFADSSYKSREIGEAIRTLEKAMLLELSYPTNSCQLPLLPNRKRTPKLFWVDFGLVSAAGNIKNDVFSTNNLLDIWKGAYAEQLVAQEILTLSNKVQSRRYFWVNQHTHSSAEIDLVYEYNEFT